MTKTDQFFTVHSLCIPLGIRIFLNFLSILHDSWDMTNNIYLFLIVCDNSVIVCNEKLSFLYTKNVYGMKVA